MYHDLFEDTWAYQEIVEQGKLLAQRQMLLDIIQERFPELVHLAKQQADTIEDPNVLRRLTVRMSVVPTLKEAEQYLLTVTGDDKKN